MKKIFKTSLMAQEKSKQINEIEVLMKVCHPNIVQLFEVINNSSKSEKYLYLIMQYLPGKSME
jgi:serine/threonine protein kinase